MKVNKRQLVAYVEAQGFNGHIESAWPRLDKAAEGGITHFVSADNGAYYAELWGRDDGSYYAVTGAGIYQMPGLAKSAKLEEALDVFLEKVVEKHQDSVPMQTLKKAVLSIEHATDQLGKQRGWTKESHESYWRNISENAMKSADILKALVSNLQLATIALGEPGGHTACVERMTGKVDDPHAFCAWAEHEGSGYWPAEKR